MTTLGKYELLAELGKGAMGTVYKARDTILDRLVALKTVGPALLSQPDARARFEREAKAAAKLHHPNIVTIHDYGEAENGEHYIAMELLEGMDLAQLMAGAAQVTRDQKVRIAVDICRGLDYAHKQGVIHRDVKPANIRLCVDGAVKILDFGIARTNNRETANLTRDGLALGTPNYMAPEVLEGGKGDHRADMWAVGIILYELLSGRRPYETQAIPALVYKVVHETPAPLDAKELGLPDSLLEVVGKALARSPDDRYTDLAAMAQALETSVGFTGREAPLPPEVRERAYESNYAEARERFAERDLEGALAAARRAQALLPSRTGILSLISVIEEQLDRADTVRRPAPKLNQSPRPGEERARSGTTPPASRLSEASPARPAPPDLKRLGANAFRELATFGELPATQAACPSPVRELLAVGSSDGAIRLWDLRSQTRTATLRSEMHLRTGHDALPVSLAFSPDGELLASGHVDGTVRLWAVAEGRDVPVRLRHDAIVGALTFSPDGSTLASGSMDATVRLWDVGAVLAGEARRELHRQPAGVTAMAYGAGGDTLLTGHASRALRLMDAATGRLIATLRGPEAQVNLIVLSPDGQHVAVASHDRAIRVFDLGARQQTAAFADHRKPATSLAFFADGLKVASVAQEGVLHLWDAATGAPLAALWAKAGESFVGVAVFEADDQVAVALGDGRIRLFEPVR